MKTIIYLRASSKTNFISSLLEHIQHLFETKVHIIIIKFASINIFYKTYTKTIENMQNIFQVSFF